MHLRKGDIVQIVSGSQRPRKAEDKRAPSGKVKQVLSDSDRVVVEGRNLVWKHQRRSRQSPRGSRHQMEAPIAASNVLLYCPSPGCLRGVRVRHQRSEKGQRLRVCVKCGHSFDS
ncbi:MAG: 50S ribosomal protein L24 [Planctomycetes bacterium]|nr:50S ribosomal protein L24 [Planctomycetota bacterium]